MVDKDARIIEMMLRVEHGEKSGGEERLGFGYILDKRDVACSCRDVVGEEEWKLRQIAQATGDRNGEMFWS